jgi:hypothetical protein
MLWVRTSLRRGVFDTILCDEVCLLLAKGRWFSPGTPVSFTDKTDRHDITEILFKVALNTTTPRSARVTVTAMRKRCTLVYPTCILVNWLIFGVNATFSNISAISWWPALVVEEARVPGENHWPSTINWQVLSLAAASRVHPFCNLQSRARTHVVLVICLYELLGNPTSVEK